MSIQETDYANKNARLETGTRAAFTIQVWKDTAREAGLVLRPLQLCLTGLNIITSMSNRPISETN